MKPKSNQYSFYDCYRKNKKNRKRDLQVKLLEFVLFPNLTLSMRRKKTLYLNSLIFTIKYLTKLQMGENNDYNFRTILTDYLRLSEPIGSPQGFQSDLDLQKSFWYEEKDNKILALLRKLMYLLIKELTSISNNSLLKNRNISSISSEALTVKLVDLCFGESGAFPNCSEESCSSAQVGCLLCVIFQIFCYYRCWPNPKRPFSCKGICSLFGCEGDCPPTGC